MNTRGNTGRGDVTRSDASNGPPEHDPDMMRVLMGMLEEQKKLREAQDRQMEMMKEGLLAAQNTATEAVNKAAAPKEQRVGNVLDFRRLNPKEFSGNETPLEADQWLADMVNLLEAAKVPEADRVTVVRVQLTDITRTWWLSEEAKSTEESVGNSFRTDFWRGSFPTQRRGTWRRSS